MLHIYVCYSAQDHSTCRVTDKSIRKMHFGARNDDFNQKASKLNRWQISVSKNHLISVRIQGPLIYNRENGWGFQWPWPVTEQSW